ncbi:hypothetical protein GCM10010508_15930 [Streptomyces naganishii JCM 4654]|uniref:Uncharacterized protein n=1 Tax=Streptomyces naganishii JCM 4654 TaxID=1306179 RepID=A0A918Y1M3_9ACTN|nr:hypothetical protein GCM10010508_15930 [Streptomyces naganishii JCM 4654]
MARFPGQPVRPGTACAGQDAVEGERLGAVRCRDCLAGEVEELEAGVSAGTGADVWWADPGPLVNGDPQEVAGLLDSAAEPGAIAGGGGVPGGGVSAPGRVGRPHG